MDAATLYTIVTLLDGREHVGRKEFASVSACEQMRRQLDGVSVKGMPTRYTCERHVKVSPTQPATARTP